MKSPSPFTTINLQQLINRLVEYYRPVADNQRCYFINGAGHGLYVNTNSESLSTLLGSLIYIVARCSRDTPILISAACYHERAAVSIQCSSREDSYRILQSFHHLELLSKELNGFLEISNYEDRETTITFNFACDVTKRNTVVKQLLRA